ncbi:retrotransposon protein, putative, ty1-copia subclass [Tanacetum coccineum]
MTTSSANNSVFRGFFEKQKLTGPNFIDWYRQLRIVLSIDDKLNYLEQPLPPAPVAPAGQHVAPEILAAHTAWVKGSKEIDGLMLMTMEPEIQRNLENLHANDMLKELKALFAQQAEHKLLQTTRDFHACKQEEGQSVSSYVIRMKGYIDNLECLGHLVILGLAVSLILIGLHKEFDRFVQNYNMHSLGKTVNELHAMLKLHEQTLNLPKNNAPALHAIRAGKVQKDSLPPKREDPAKDSICHECGETGTLEEELSSVLSRVAKRRKRTQPLVVVVVQVKGQGRKLKPGGLLCLYYVGNGQREAVERELISVPVCTEDGFINRFVNNTIQVSRITSNKKSKLDLDSALLWALSSLDQSHRNALKSWQHDGLSIQLTLGLLKMRSLYVWSFWDYALETAARILNMVPTKRLKRHHTKALVKRDTLTKPDKLEPSYEDSYSHSRVLMTMRLAKGCQNLPSSMDIQLKRFKGQQPEASGSNVTFLILYVDDILIMGNSIPMLQDVKSYLGKCFAMKDLGEAAYILGIKIYRDRSRRLIGLCQSAYIEKILKRFHMENSKRGSIPMQDKLRLSKSQGASTPAELKRMQSVPYASAVGSIMYAVRCTRPDVAFAQNITSRFQQNPGDLHWTTVKNILKYLRNTKDMFLVYGGDLKRELRVSCYTDAGYLTDADDLKSQTGYVFVLNGGAVDWKSAKQSIFATSSAEAEYIAAFDASKEAVWYGLGNSFLGSSGITKGARHFRAKVHYLREVIEFGDIKLEKVHTDDNLADPLVTTRWLFQKIQNLLRILEWLQLLVSTGDTPFSLVYGTEAVIPAEIGMPTIRTAEVNIATNDDERRIDLDILEERREQAAIREEKAKLKMKGYYDAKVRGVSFRPGDFVYRANDASHAEDTGKLGPKWEGPYEVTEALGKGAYKLRDMDGRELPRTWNICNLKKCYL